MDEDSPRPCSTDDLGPRGTYDAISTNLQQAASSQGSKAQRCFLGAFFTFSAKASASIPNVSSKTRFTSLVHS